MKNYREYVRTFSPEVRRRLDEIRKAIGAAIPDATETISYGIPSFILDGRKVVWFAAFKKHVGFYPGSAAIAAFAEELSPYKTAKGSVQLPYDAPLPRALVSRMTKYAAKARSAADRGKG